MTIHCDNSGFYRIVSQVSFKLGIAIQTPTHLSDQLFDGSAMINDGRWPSIEVIEKDFGRVYA